MKNLTMRYLCLGIIFFAASCVYQEPANVVVEAPVSESTVPGILIGTYLSVTVLDSTISVKSMQDKAAIVKDTAG